MGQNKVYCTKLLFQHSLAFIQEAEYLLIFCESHHDTGVVYER